MAGKNVVYDQTYLTAPQVYRLNITDVDPSPLVDDGGHEIPDIRVDIDQSLLAVDQAVKYAPKYSVSSRAYNAHLELYIHAGGLKTKPYNGLILGLAPEGYTDPYFNIKVWGWSGVYNNAAQVVSAQGRWCLVHEQSIVDDTLIVLRNIPNTKYRVSVPYMSGDIYVAAIIHQHTI